MHTIQLELDDTLYDDIVKKGIDIQALVKDTLKKALYSKEHKIASDINQSIQDVKAGNSKPISELFSEL
ncbi:MAG: hypothetical protein DRG78_14255 [Epsilonproteobacteria bacterium]|nr:MAG: hypothetical protein DRG78_14255 [Campylobacterota bacterium]